MRIVATVLALNLALWVSAGARAGLAEFSWDVSGAMNPLAPRVVLLHGLNRTSRSMRPLAQVLAARGYAVVNMDYPSSQYPLAELGRRLGRALEQCCRPAPPGGFNFITHSLGGIILREYARHGEHLPIGRVVMLGPPNQGSELTDKLRTMPFYQLLTGPVGQQLGTDPDSAPNRLGPVSFQLGVIAGTGSFNPLYSWLIPGPDDGKVAVSRTRVAGLVDFIRVDASHSFMMSNPRVMEQCLNFLQQGRFDHSPQG